MEDMCYERRRAEACVDQSAHHALANAGGREIVGKKEGEKKVSARGSVHWGCYYATALDIEVDPQRCCLGSRQSDFALQAVVECCSLEQECFRGWARARSSKSLNSCPVKSQPGNLELK